MVQKLDNTMSVIVAGVGGQGAITLAQLLLGAVWRSGYSCLQSEVHGMSQRGGAVNAHVIFDSEAVTAPVVMEGGADLLISMEPLETMRYLSLLKKDGVIISSKTPIKGINDYPEVDKILQELKSNFDAILIDTDEIAKELKNKQATNVILLGKAANYLPIEDNIWKNIFEERFQHKGESVINKNIEAFEYGKKI